MMNRHVSKPDTSSDTSPEETKETGLGRNVIALGWVAFFGGLSQDMILPILSTFYTTVLGLRPQFIGLIEGLADHGCQPGKDRRRLSLGCVGPTQGHRLCWLCAFGVARLGLGFASSGAARLRAARHRWCGQGIEGRGRDALVAGSAGDRKLGFAFGVQRTLDTLGSVVGPLITFELLRVWATHPNKYREVFLVAGLVATIPLLIIGLLVRERKTAVSKQRLSFDVLRGPFGGFLVVMLLLTLGNSSDAFLILRAKMWGWPR